MKPLKTVAAILAVCAVSTTAMLAPTTAHAQSKRPVTLIVPFAPGGATDMVGRLLANELSDALGQSVIVDNRAGAAGSVGMGELSRAAPDSQTYALITDSIPIQPLINDKLAWDMDNFRAIAKIATSPEVLVVHPDVAADDVGEFIQYAQEQDGALSYAASGTGSVHHLAGEKFKQQNNVDMVHIPYKGGGQSIIDLVAGRVDAAFIGLAPVLAHLESGKLRALAQTGSERNALAASVPTFEEAGYGDFDVELWIGLVGHKDTPEEDVKHIQTAVESVLATPDMQKKLRDVGFKAVTESNEGFPQWMQEQQSRWRDVIDQVGLKND